MPAPLNTNECRLSTPCLLHVPLIERKPLMLAVACANVYSGCITMAPGDFFIQPYQFDPESDPEAPEEVQTL